MIEQVNNLNPWINGKSYKIGHIAYDARVNYLMKIIW